MAFEPRSFEEIVSDMISYVRSRTNITDMNVGSVVRTMLEAAALEDDEQYFQMVQLLDAFSIRTAIREQLDRRMADFGIPRQPSRPAFGRLRFFNENILSSNVALQGFAGDASIVVFDATKFPVDLASFVIRVGEGTAVSQNLIVTAVDTVGNILTLDATTLLKFDIEVGLRVSLVGDSSAGQVVAAGTRLRVPATETERAKTYISVESATITPGNFFSGSVLFKSIDMGLVGNVGVGRVVQFDSSPPFVGAGVTNVSAAVGGVETESDRNFRIRGLASIQSLSKGTKLAIKTAAIGVEVPATGQRVVSASVQEAFDEERVILFVDDGSGLTPDRVILPNSIVSAEAFAADVTLTVTDVSIFPSSGFIYIDDSAAELVEYTLTDSVTNSLVLATGLVSGHAVDEPVRFVDVLTNAAESGQRRFRLANPPVVIGSERIFVKPLGGIFELLVENVDYKINHGTGDLIIISPAGITVGSVLLANYTYNIGLLRSVQQVMEGVIVNPIAFPGVKSAGINLTVSSPDLVSIVVEAVLTAETGFDEKDLRQPVIDAIQGYINSRIIGEEVIRNKIVDVAYNVEGVRDVVVRSPSSNVSVLENQLPRTFDADGNSLITVT